VFLCSFSRLESFFNAAADAINHLKNDQQAKGNFAEKRAFKASIDHEDWFRETLRQICLLIPSVDNGSFFF
jgi:hypothetical protein